MKNVFALDLTKDAKDASVAAWSAALHGSSSNLVLMSTSGLRAGLNLAEQHFSKRFPGVQLHNSSSVAVGRDAVMKRLEAVAALFNELARAEGARVMIPLG